MRAAGGRWACAGARVGLGRGISLHDVARCSAAARRPLLPCCVAVGGRHAARRACPSSPRRPAVPAGEGEDGRMKSAIGIGALLMDGLGDTIRVSLTEDPEYEIDPCGR